MHLARVGVGKKSCVIVHERDRTKTQLSNHAFSLIHEEGGKKMARMHDRATSGVASLMDYYFFLHPLFSRCIYLEVSRYLHPVFVAQFFFLGVRAPIRQRKNEDTSRNYVFKYKRICIDKRQDFIDFILCFSESRYILAVRFCNNDFCCVVAHKFLWIFTLRVISS